MSTWQETKPRTLAWVKRERRRLVKLLGGKCERCGLRRKLEFHHTRPRYWIASQLNRWQRLAEYKRDIARGHIELLCTWCNKRAGQPVARAA